MPHDGAKSSGSRPPMKPESIKSYETELRHDAAFKPLHDLDQATQRTVTAVPVKKERVDTGWEQVETNVYADVLKEIAGTYKCEPDDVIGVLEQMVKDMGTKLGLFDDDSSEHSASALPDVPSIVCKAMMLQSQVEIFTDMMNNQPK